MLFFKFAFLFFAINLIYGVDSEFLNAFITLDINITRSGDLIRNKYEELTHKWHTNESDSVNYFIPINNISLEMASFTLDGPADEKSRVYSTMINMRKGDLCQFFPFRLPTVNYHIDAEEKEFYMTIHAPAELRNYFINRLNLDGYLEDRDHTPRVILAQVPQDAVRPGAFPQAWKFNSYVQYRPHMSLMLCERKDSLRSTCKKWRDVGEKICGQEMWWE